MATVQQIAEDFGLVNVDAALAAAKATGFPIAAALALVQMESGGANVYGGDAGGYFSQTPRKRVTEANYAEFYDAVINKGKKSNGVGPLQITYKAFHPDAKAKGLELWKPEDNFRYGFALAESYRDGSNWQYVGRRYNGKDSYGVTFARRVQEWEKRLAGASEETTPAPKEEENEMAKPMTPAQLVAAFKKWGVKVEEHDGWRGHDRPGSFSPVGVMIHHTAGSSDAADERVLFSGRSDLPGPLSQWGTKDDGTVVMLGSGRANHGGTGSGTTLAKVKAANYSGNITPGADNTDGNTNFWGNEVMYSGTKPPTAAQVKSMVLTSAAICDFYGWSEKAVIGHKEWTKRKIDPFGVDMKNLRADIKKALAGGPAGEGAEPTPEPEPSGDYIVVAGDTLASIAAAHGTEVEYIVRRNDIQDPNVISVGQVLVIPTGEGYQGDVPGEPAPDPEPTPEEPTANDAAEKALVFLKAEADSDTTKWNQLCLKLARTAYGVPAKNPTATAGWHDTDHRGGTGLAAMKKAPRGALVWWTGGSAGHVAISDGQGRAWGNWYPNGGRVELQEIGTITSRLNLKPAGWSYDVNGVRVLDEVGAAEPTPTPPADELEKLDPGVKPGKRHPQVRRLQQWLLDAGYGPIRGSGTTYYGLETEAAVARFHKANPKFSHAKHDVTIGTGGFKELQKQAKK